MVQQLFERLSEDALVTNHRRLLVLSGEQHWCYQQLQFLSDQKDVYWIGDSKGNQRTNLLGNHQCYRLLGQSLSHLVYDAWDGLNPNSFGLVSGCLSGGSIMLLLCPDLDEWQKYDDPEHQSIISYPFCSSDAGRRFIGRFIHAIEDDAYAVVYRQSDQESGIEVELPGFEINHCEDEEAVLPSKTIDQQHAVELILSQFRRGRRPAVITADRGRGKSTALGIAAAQLSGLDFTDILITASEYSAVEAAFQMAHQLLPDYEFSKGLLQHKGHRIQFVEPDIACHETGEGKVMLVDEAAAIPVPVLTRLLKHFPRIAFSSTIHGYEGTGRGFTLRFKKILQRETPNWKELHMNSPIRWWAEDPLERFVFNALLLDAEPLDDQIVLKLHSSESLLIEKIDRNRLIEDYSLLEQVFGLLVLAHYRTTPGDLRVLLDSPNLHVWIMRAGEAVVGAVLVAEEGPLQQELVDEIWAGKRRPRGHLMPQTLVSQEGCRDAAAVRFGRIMRIVIHPTLQRHKLGSELLSTLTSQGQALGWDCLGSSFSASSDLMNFWQGNGFETVRLGSARDAVSGNHAGMVLKPLNSTGEELSLHLRTRYLEQVKYRLSEDLVDLESEMVCRLLSEMEEIELTSHDWSDLESFTQHNRGYEGAAFAIYKYLIMFVANAKQEQLNALHQDPDFRLLIEKNIQQKSWLDLERNGQGRKQIVAQMRSVLTQMLRQWPNA